jgi:hypothetical protein
MVKQGFRNANRLALRLMNAVSSANGRRKRMAQFVAFRVSERGNCLLPAAALDGYFRLHPASIPKAIE